MRLRRLRRRCWTVSSEKELLAIGNLFQSFAEGFTAPMVDGKFSVKEAPLILGQSAVRTVESHSVSNEIEVSIVIPCLNEAETVGICVEKALQWIRDQGIHGEVILADNGSTDGSREIAQSKGARVIEIPNKGYGKKYQFSTFIVRILPKARGSSQTRDNFSLFGGMRMDDSQLLTLPQSRAH